ncbi:acyltransferase [Vibrio owensii]|uniref:acyltransferase n=1 Tax=Vibrio owensii TaxID=696485 RepID=UPI002F41A138
MSKIKHLSELPHRILVVLSQIFPNNATGCKLRGFVYKYKLKSAGKNLQIATGVIIDNPKNLIVGDNVYIGHNSWINAIGEGIEFGDEVMLGPSVHIVSNNHGYDYERKSSRFAPGCSKKICIGSGVWVGSGAFIGNGVQVGVGSTIGANSTVVKSLPEACVAVGSPAKVIKHHEK